MGSGEGGGFRMGSMCVSEIKKLKKKIINKYRAIILDYTSGLSIIIRVLKNAKGRQKRDLE